MEASVVIGMLKELERGYDQEKWWKDVLIITPHHVQRAQYRTDGLRGQLGFSPAHWVAGSDLGLR